MAISLRGDFGGKCAKGNLFLKNGSLTREGQHLSTI